MVTRLSTWDPDFASAFGALLAAKRETAQDVSAPVAEILADVRERGDVAVIELTEKFDGLKLSVEMHGGRRCRDRPGRRPGRPCDDRGARPGARRASAPITSASVPLTTTMSTHSACASARAGRRSARSASMCRAATASYPSSVLMNAIPAHVAGVERIVMVVPSPQGNLNPLVLVAARIAGVSEIYRIGGAQAIARARLWHGDNPRRSTRSSAPAMPMSPRPSARCSDRSAST